MLKKTIKRQLFFMLTILCMSSAAQPLWAGPAMQEDSAALSGVVVNVADGRFIARAELRILPLQISVTTDLDGLYSVELPPGEYSIKINIEGYNEQTVRGIRLAEGATVFQDIALTPAGMDLGQVTVVAEAEQASRAALLAERKSAAALSEGIGAQEMSRLAGSDAADVMQRVTGVSVVDDRYVYVRGLGERYSSTMLNGARLNSPQPDKKVVPMDLFPASLLENIRIEKSYTPDQPGEFSGGTVKVETIDFPRTPVFKISVGQGFGTNTTFQDFQDYPGGKWDFLGFDDGTRSLPGIVPSEKVIRTSRFTSNGFTPQQLTEFGQSFSNVWTPKTETAIPDQNFSLMAGNTIGKLGFVVAFAQSNKFHHQDEIQNVFKVGSQGQIEPFNDFDFAISQRSIRTGLTANVAYQWNDDHRFHFRNFFTKNTTDEARTFEGFNGDADNRVRNTRLRFTEEGVYSGQFGGEHFLHFFGNSVLEWKMTYSRSTLDEPDLREVLFEERGGQFVLADESQSGFRQFNDLFEDGWEPAVDWTFYFNQGSLDGKIKFGGTYGSRQRDFSSRRFRFVPRNTGEIDLTRSPEELFSSENLEQGIFELREETRPTDTYDAQEITRSGYAMLDVSFRKWRFIGGARVESDTQVVETFDPFDRSNPNTITSRLQNTDFLPAINVVYRLSPDMNLRGSFSKTVNRPQFRELAPFEFTDVVGGRAIVGNPDLKRALIRNYDLRWEWFVGAEELISASFFFKDFDDPIEQKVEPTAQLRTSFVNADSATNLGFELDLRKNLGFWSEKLEKFTVSSNYTFVDSNVTIPEAQLNVLTSLSRPLAGQSRHVINLAVDYELRPGGTLARMLFNYQGKRITDVGALGLPDIFQNGYPQLDGVFIHPFSSSWKLKFSVENLLNQTRRFVQGGETQRAFRAGRVFRVTISRSLFPE